MSESPRVAAVADIGGTNIRTALITAQGDMIARDSWPVLRDASARENTRRIVESLWALTKASGLPRESVIGMAACVAAVVDGRKGYVYDVTNLGWRDFPLTAWLHELSGIPALIEMDAHAAALGEAWKGTAQGAQDFILLIVGTGIGAGLVFDGQLIRGFAGLAGEVGHMVVQAEGPLCGCGRHGCLEAVASGLAIGAAARAALARGVPTSLQGEPTAADVIAAARTGDPCALRITEYAARSLGIGIANLINGLSPELIVLGGGVILNGADVLLPRVRAEVEHQLNYGMRSVPRRIELAALGDSAGLYGVAHRVFEEYGRG